LATACALLAELYSEGQGVSADPVVATDLYHTACEGAVPAACTALARRYHKKDGVEKDKARSRQLYYQACSLGDEAACAKAR
jgi:TPR repeat protein